VVGDQSTSSGVVLACRFVLLRSPIPAILGLAGALQM
jgi:hypothetical protein